MQVRTVLLVALTTLPLAFASATYANSDKSSMPGSLKISGKQVLSPEPGVICDRYVCADQQGLSMGLTEQYLGKKAHEHLMAMGDIETTEFTLANGVFCDTKTKTCHVNRYLDGKTGKRAKIATKQTQQLFGKK